MRIKDPVEFLYLMLMHKWERNAPIDRHQGLLDGKPERNTQISRMAYVLKKIGAGTEDHVFGTLARYTYRDDGESYISKNSSWMKQPYPLFAGWHFEGCTSLLQKQSFLQHLTKVGLSSPFVACADDFVAGKSVKKYLPTHEEMEEMIHKNREKEQRDEA